MSFFAGLGLLLVIIPINAITILFSQKRPKEGMQMALGGIFVDFIFTGIYTVSGLVVFDLPEVPFVLGLGAAIMINIVYKSIHAILTDHRR
jgi:hypothetical protein